MNLRTMVAIACFALLPPDAGRCEDQPRITAPGFEGEILGLEIHAGSLGVVLDISESMQRRLPAVRARLRDQLPRNPILHVDGCALEKPGPLATVRNGVASETVTAVTLLAEHAKVTAILWICDAGDPPNRAGVEAMAEALERHGLTLYLISLGERPGPSLRKLVEDREGQWRVASLEVRDDD